MSGMGVPSALHTREALLFSRTLTVEGELSRSLKLGGTGRLRGIDVLTMGHERLCIFLTLGVNIPLIRWSFLWHNNIRYE